MLQDVRFALRFLARRRAFALSVARVDPIVCLRTE